MGRPVSVKFNWNGMSKSLWINPGLDSAELRKTLCAAFGLPDESIQGVFVSDTGKSHGLDRVGAAPSSFSVYKGIHIILSEDVEEEPQPQQQVAKRSAAGRLVPRMSDISSKFFLRSDQIPHLVRMFDKHAPDGLVDSTTFAELFRSYLRNVGEEDQQRAGQTLGQLFAVFDKDGDGVVDSREFLSGLTVLSEGSRDEKIRLAFDLYDKDGNGYIELEEMKAYLGSVFAVIRQRSEEVFARHGVNEMQLAEITAEQAFREADLDRDGRLSWDEFKRWYSSGPPGLAGASAGVAPAVPAGDVSLLSLSRNLAFDQFSAEDVFDVFAEHANEGALDVERFFRAYEQLVHSTGIRLQDPHIRKQLEQLFDIFDQDNNGVVDFEELGSGLTILAKGSRDDKVRAAFSLYDYNDDGYITVDEMINYMSSVFRLLFSSSPEVARSMGDIDADELGEITAQQCFAEADLDGDGRLTFEEFREWYSKPSSMRQTLPLPPQQPQRRERQQASLASQNVGLERIRALTGVGSLDVFTVFDQFAVRVTDEGYLTWPAFQDSFEAVRRLAGLPGHQDTASKRLYDAIVHRLFQLFDRDGNGIVDFTELASGLGVLTRNTSSPHDKVRATFSLFDTNGDGFISVEEMERYLGSLYTVLFEISTEAEAKAGGLSPEALARLTTMDCFQRADTDRDGRLSFDEFARWYQSGGPSDSEGAGSLALPRPPTEPTMDFAEVRALTGLGSLAIEDLFDLLSESIDPGSAGLSRTSFQSAMQRVAPARVDRGRLNLVLSRLFDIFDTDGDGRVSFQELVSGLSLLCAGDADDKAETAFQIFDYNGDGFVSQEELRRYMMASFRLIYATDPHAAARAGGLGPDEVALATTQSIFAEADLNHDNRLSWDEFERWYKGPAGPAPSSTAVAAAASRESSDHWLSIEEVRRLTCLDRYSPEEAFEVLASVADEGGLLNKQAFFRAFHQLVARHGDLASEEDLERLKLVLHRLFDTFDADANGAVDFAELSSGLSILCGGNQDDKAKAAFQLYDVNGDNRISKEEMQRYLTCVFKVMYQTQPGTREQTGGVSAEELAWNTAEKVFQEADLDGNGELDLEEFRRWYSKGTGRQLSVAADLMAADADWFNVDEIRRLTGIDSFSATELFHRFAEAAREDPAAARSERIRRFNTSNMFIGRESFDEVFQDLIGDDKCQTEDDFVRLTFILDRLYDMFDINGDGKVDFSELSTGLSVLCAGSRDEKIEAAFALFDENGDGMISQPEMVRYLTSLYKVLVSTQASVRATLGATSPEELAEVTARQCFAEADSNRDGKLSLEEFQAWIKRPAGQALQQIVEAAPEFVNMDEIRRLTKIHLYAAEDIRDQIASFSNEDGVITRDNFMAAFREIVSEASPESEPTTPAQERHLAAVLNRLFDIFDTDNDGVVDSKELAAGLSILCGGDRDSKAAIAFDLFDYDGNRAISLPEMERYLTSVFKVMYETKPNTAENVGATPEALAKATADQIFIEADLDHNGELDFDEFKRWYNKTASGQAMQELNSEVPAWVTLDEIRKLTRLDQYAPSDVFETFARHTQDGELDRHTFERAFREVAMSRPESLDSDDLDRLHLVINRVFDAFDVSKTGVVEFTDLVSGLSVLCGGTRDMRAEAAFALYDYDGDNYIQRTEMLSYLTSVFRVMFELQPGTKERMGGVEASALAAATCDQIFAEADLNHDDKLSFEEFRAWYSSTDQVRKGAPPPAPPPTGPASLAEARVLTGLAHMEASEAFERFATYADTSGELTRGAFEAVFHEIMSEKAAHNSPVQRTRAERVIHHLFELFDQDRNGAVDFIELASGLSVLCGGSGDSRAEAVFRLYDHDGTGFISMASMEWYLNSVFRLMYETQPGTQDRMGGVGPEELARATAQQIFAEADLNQDNQISWEEFKAWFSSDAATSINQLTRDAPSWLTLDEIRRITGLGDWSQRDVFEEFALAVDDEGMLGPQEFKHVFGKLMDPSRLPAEDQQRWPLVLHRLFEIFDADGNGRVDFSEMASGISILCNDPRDVKAEAAFALFDEDEDGFVDPNELRRYLTSVFRVMFETDSSARDSAAGLSPEELAEATATQIFADADTDGDNRLSFPEFKAWYEHGGSSLLTPTESGPADPSMGPTQDTGYAPPPGVVRAFLVQDGVTAPDWLSLEEVKRLTGFGEREVGDLFEEFASFTNDEGALDRAAFERAFDALTGGRERSEEDAHRLSVVRRRLFDIFDLDGNGKVDFSEVASGLSILASTESSERRVEAIFSLYDYNKDGFITLDELERALSAIFRVMYETEPSTARRSGSVPPEKLAKATALHIFSDADLNSDGKLSMQEFSRWFRLSGDTVASSIDTITDGALRNITLEEARRVTGLGELTPDEVFQEFAMATDDEGMLSRESFFATFQDIVARVKPQTGPEDAGLLQLVLTRLFQVFDRAKTGRLDFSDLSSGLSILCKGEREDKVRSAFALYDVDGDGYITMAEMQSYLTALFSLLFELMPGTQDRVEVSPSELAAATTEQCFEEADLNHDGKLSFEEFNLWFSSSSLFPEPGAPAARAQQEPAAASPNPKASPKPEASTPVSQLSGLSEIKRLTKLGNLEVSEVLDSIRSIAGEGSLNFQTFVSVFEMLIEQGGGHSCYNDQAAASAVVRQLFDLFDQDGNGEVDSRELASGLSVLCQGSREEKVKTAFELYDTNNDGYISLEEMVNYLTSVFKVLYASQPETARTFGVTAETLGLVTAEQCFLEADKNQDGRLSFEEFADWYSKREAADADADQL